MSDTDSRTPDVTELIGTTIGERYRLTEVLGTGGMGAVLRAQHLGLGRDVALKILHAEMAEISDIEKRFAREARSIATLHHPNIVQVSDFGKTSGGLQYLVMELLVGETLADLLGEPLPPARVVTLTKQILRGLEHAHSRGIVHRDLKPENIFITHDHDGVELLKIVDFGLAKAFGTPSSRTKPGLTMAGMAVGTPRYMSPEQTLAQDVDSRADLYTIGILMYEMLSGAVPFDDPDLVKLLSQQLRARHRPLGSDVPAWLAHVVDRLLEKSREDRYPSATAVLEALEAGASASPQPDVHGSAVTLARAVEEEAQQQQEQTAPPPTEAVPEPPTPPPRRKPRSRPAAARRRRPLIRGPIAAAGVLAAVLVGWVLWEPDRALERLENLADGVAKLLWRVSQSE